MIVNGIKKENVEVDVEPRELVRGLAKTIGVQALFEDSSDEYAILEEKEERYYIVFYRNMSYHGTPHYNEYTRNELSKEEYTVANGLKEMMKLINNAN